MKHTQHATSVHILYCKEGRRMNDFEFEISFQYRQAMAALTHGDDDEGGSALGRALPDM